MGWSDQPPVTRTKRVYSSSKIVHGPNGFVGGLIGSAAGNTIDGAYFNGAISGDSSGGFLGGLMGSGASNTVTDAFWDVDTTGVATSSDGGTGLTTDQFRAQLPGTFPPMVWGITSDLSYPYLKDDRLRFRSPLATLVVGGIPVVSFRRFPSSKSRTMGRGHLIETKPLSRRATP